ncbi:SIR2 family protein [Paenibacillus sp. FA6]|uniref:SIR2 family protein n=1 Tax=Paenibacillus sp. FA6 TaxID=3413029 RepID=UPI003F65DEFA
MEYLRELFHDSLNSEGEVDIAGYRFDRDSILRTLEEEGYKEAFSQWLEDRKDEMVNKANKILALYDNADRFRLLQRAYRRGAIIPFVGAGLSMSSGYPGWTRFLYKLLPETRISKFDLDNLIATGQYEEAAQLLFDDMPHGTFLEVLENNFGCTHELVGPVQRLPFLFTQSLITTNFDDVIQRSYESADKSFGEILLGVQAQELPRKLGEGKHVLVKLHGKSDSNRDRVLTKNEYDKHYQDTNALEQVIEASCCKTLLFLGCSLTVDRTLQAMANIMQRRGEDNVPRHYAFVSLKDTDDRIARKNQLSESNIFPIWYPNDEDHDECIEALLIKLQEGGG